MGTRFVASHESMAADAYKQMLIDIADETWGFPPLFERWRRERGV